MYALEFRKAVVQLYYFFNSMRKTSQALKISIALLIETTKEQIKEINVLKEQLKEQIKEIMEKLNKLWYLLLQLMVMEMLV